MIGWCEDEENAEDGGEPGKGLVKGWGNEDQHQGQERSESDPVKNFENRIPLVFLRDLCG